ncbi:MAG: ATP-binding protein [Spongiibacteraceae bacterium]
MALLTAAKANLQRLALVRLLALTGQLMATIYAYGWLRAPLNYAALFAILGLLALATIFTFWRLGRSWPVTDPEFFAQLLFDVGSLSALLYLSGGATNPFVSYYLVPLTIAATVLPWRYTLALSAISIVAYTALLFFYEPLPLFAPVHDHSHALMQHGQHGLPQPTQSINPHILGMWFNFTLSAALVTSVVVRMANALREQQRELNMRRENALHSEQLLAVATLAAGTAHELGTPLNTMTLVLDDMHSGDANVQADIALLKQQTQICRATLKKLVDTAETHRQQQFERQAADRFLHELLERWQVMRPDARYALNIESANTEIDNNSAPHLRADEALRQAIIHLLDNGADTQSGPLELRLRWDANNIELRIRDHGPGIAHDIAEQIGKPFVTSKRGGLGLGLFLSHATIERCGGEIRLFNHAEGGTEAVLKLPIAEDAATS